MGVQAKPYPSVKAKSGRRGGDSTAHGYCMVTLSQAWPEWLHLQPHSPTGAPCYSLPLLQAGAHTSKHCPPLLFQIYTQTLESELDSQLDTLPPEARVLPCCTVLIPRVKEEIDHLHKTHFCFHLNNHLSIFSSQSQAFLIVLPSTPRRYFERHNHNIN